MTLSPTSKLLFTLALFAVAVALVVVASAVHEAAPLFFAWIPLLTVAWVLTRPESATPETQASPVEPPPDPDVASTEQNEPPAGPEEPTPSAGLEEPPA